MHTIILLICIKSPTDATWLQETQRFRFLMAKLEDQKGEADKSQSTNAPKQEVNKGLQIHMFLLVDQITAKNFEIYVVF